MKGKEPDETITIATLTWMGIITRLTLTLWVVAIRNKKKCKSHYSLCHQEAKPGEMMTAYSTHIAEKNNQTNKKFQDLMEALAKIEREMNEMKRITSNQSSSSLLPRNYTPIKLPLPRPHFNIS